MKKILLALLILCCTVTVTNAQLFLGSSLGFNYSSDSHDGNNLGSTIAFGIAPEVGYSLSDRWDLGIAVAFGMENEKIETPDTKNNKLGWGVAPFARYSFFQFGRFEIIGRAELYITSSTDKTKLGNVAEVTNENLISYGLQISPILAYNLSDRILLQAQMNFFALNLEYTSENQSKNSNLNAGLGINSNNLFNLGALNLGFIYRF